MSRIKNLAWLKSSAVCGAVLLTSAPLLAQEVDLSDPEAISNYVEFSDSSTEDSLEVQKDLEADRSNPLEQVTNVNQLRDVSPTDWAYEALRSLVDRYGCIAGYPNQTYRGSQALTRYEFAAGLNSCLNQIERLIASSVAVRQEDLDTMLRLSREFEAELASIGGRLDNLENRTAFLEVNAFSTTTVLQGEVAFNLAHAFGDSAAADLDGDGSIDDLDAETVFSNRVRLQLVSSFTGKDKLFTRLTAGNIGNSFQDETGTREGRFAYDGPSDNDVVIDRLHYVFPLLSENLQVTAMASLAAHHFYAEVFNDLLNVGGGANGALTRFAERSPIYRQGIDNGSAGLGATYTIGEKFEVSAGYIAPNASDPDEGNGIFNGSFSALGQLVFKPFESLKIGATYVRGYDTSPFRGSFLWGGTGTNAANFRDLGVDDSPVTTNSFGGQFQFDLSSRISLRGWFSYTDADILEDGSAEILNYAGAVVFPDLVKEGSLGAVVVGAEPYINDLNLDSGLDIDNDIPLHVEAFYKYQLNDNISLTPGIVWLVSPNQNSDNDDIIIGAFRTTFTF